MIKEYKVKTLYLIKNSMFSSYVDSKLRLLIFDQCFIESLFRPLVPNRSPNFNNT